MGQRFLIDSNVVIDYLKGTLPSSGMNLMNHIVDDFINIENLKILNPWE